MRAEDTSSNFRNEGLRHTDLQGVWRAAREGVVTLPVLVKPKKTRLDTDALKGFDDI